MANNDTFKDLMDNTNNIAKTYGFANGADWAESAEIAGEITASDLSNFKNCHELRIRIAHGNSRDIFVSDQTLGYARKYNRAIKNTKLRKRKPKVNLPDGTFRGNPYIKEFNYKGESGRNYYFKFEITFEYMERAYNDGSRFKGKGYAIYVKNAPYMDWCITNNTNYEFHYYAPKNETPSICWNKLVTDFQDANAVMFIWVKRYVAIIDKLISNGNINTSSINKKIHNKGILPQGTFRTQNRNNNKKSKKYSHLRNVYITEEIYQQIVHTLGTMKPELGGILGWTMDKDTIDTFVFDKNARVGKAEYNPDIKFLNNMLNGKWNDEGIIFAGFIHSHPNGQGQPSPADIEYAVRIMAALEVEYLFQPIVTSSYDSKTAIFGYIVYKNGDYERCNIIKCPPKTQKFSEQMDDEKLKAIEEAFDQMATPIAPEDNDSLPKKNSVGMLLENSFDIDYLSKCTIIGIGCGGARPFYEDMARMGVGNFILMDGDVCEKKNISTQGVRLNEIGKYKVEVVRDELFQISQNINCVAINKMLTDELSDEWIENNILKKLDISKTLLCAFTDDFFAQARISNIALKYGLPLLCAQHHQYGLTSELLFYYQGVTPYTPQEILFERYEYYKNGGKNDVTSDLSPIFNTTRLNALAEKLAVGLLLYTHSKESIYCSFLNKYQKNNYLIIGQHDLSYTDSTFKGLFYNDVYDFVDNVKWLQPTHFFTMGKCKDISDTRILF